MRTATQITCPCGAPCGREYPDRISHLDGGEPGYSEGVGENYVVGDVWHCSAAYAIKCIDENIEQWRILRGDWAMDENLGRFWQAEEALAELYALRVRFWEQIQRGGGNG